MPPLPLPIPPFLHPSILNQSLLWPGIWFLFSSFFFVVILFFNSFLLCDFIHLLSFSLNSDLSLWRSGVLPPSLYLSLSIAGSVCRSPVSVRLSVYPSVHVSIRLSVRCWGAHGMWGGCGDPHFLRGCWSWVSPCVGLPISVKPWGFEPEPMPIPPFCGCLTWVRMSRIFLWAN